MATRPFRRRRLGRELAAERAAAHLTAEQVAARAEMAVSTITRIESGKMGAKLATIKTILSVYEMTADRRELILELARHATGDSWWHPYAGDTLPKWFQVYVDLEAEASKLAIFDPQYINGLVQTEDYARALYRAGRPDETEEEIERLVAVRMERQKRLVEGRISLRLIIDEYALQRQFGGREVMRGQLERLTELAELRRVSFQILPAGEQPGIIGGFTILEFPSNEDPAVVYIEHEAGALYLEKPAQIRAYVGAYDRLRAAARSPQDSVVQIAQLVKEM